MKRPSQGQGSVWTRDKQQFGTIQLPPSRDLVKFITHFTYELNGGISAHSTGLLLALNDTKSAEMLLKEGIVRVAIGVSCERNDHSLGS